MTRSNVLRVTPDGQIRELMIQQLEARRMPLAPETIDDASRVILLEWLKLGAPAIEPQACEQKTGVDIDDAGTLDDADAPE
ncbi:MAG: hypothetical protein K0S65_4436 [Labilithrix sp.]|nr:hypothetical protein [Labilithrix sp.]